MLRKTTAPLAAFAIALVLLIAATLATHSDIDLMMSTGFLLVVLIATLPAIAFTWIDIHRKKNWEGLIWGFCILAILGFLALGWWIWQYGQACRLDCIRSGLAGNQCDFHCGEGFIIVVFMLAVGSALVDSILWLGFSTILLLAYRIYGRITRRQIVTKPG